MERIIVSQEGENNPYINYLYNKAKEKFSLIPTDLKMKEEDGRTTLTFIFEKKYSDYIRRYIEKYISEILSIGYKFNYFEKRLYLPLLKNGGKEIFLSALIAADLKDEEKYILTQLDGQIEYCIDGVYNFRLSDLKKRWQNIIDYIPVYFNEYALEDFMDFFVNENNNKVFLKDGKLYDEEYRLIFRSNLTKEKSIIREIILSEAKNIYCFGKVDDSTKNFLKKYYREKVVFC